MRPLVVLAQNPTTTPTLPPRQPQEAGPLTDLLVEWTGWEWLETVGANLVEPVLEAVVIVLLALIASRLLKRGITRLVERMKDPDHEPRVGLLRRRIQLGELEEGQRPYSERRARRADSLGALGRSVTGFAVWVIAIMMILDGFGIPVGPLIAGAGILGVALGFGSQNLVKDFLSGIFMLIEDQYGVGDIIDSGEASGVVEGVGLRTTRIRSVDGTLWHVPNGEIRRVGNMSQQWARALLDVGVAYGTDIDHASTVILDVAQGMADDPAYAGLFLETPEVWGVQNLGPDSIDIRLVIKTKPGEQWPIMRELRRRLKAAFDEAGIEIPFPQRTIWVRGDGAALGEAAGASGTTAPTIPAAEEEERGGRR